MALLPPAAPLAAPPYSLPTPAMPASEDPVDPKPRIEKQCHSSCKGDWAAYEKCTERIKAKGSGSCEPWHFDYLKCIDKCVRLGATAAAAQCSGLLGHCARPLTKHTHTRARARTIRTLLSHFYPQTAPKLFALLK